MDITEDGYFEQVNVEREARLEAEADVMLQRTKDHMALLARKAAALDTLERLTKMRDIYLGGFGFPGVLIGWDDNPTRSGHKAPSLVEAIEALAREVDG